MEKRTRRQISTLLAVLFLSFSMVLSLNVTNAEDTDKQNIITLPEDVEQFVIEETTQNLIIEKKWIDSEGNEKEWEEEAEVIVDLYKDSNSVLEKVGETNTFTKDNTSIEIQEVALEKGDTLFVHEQGVNADDYDSYILTEVEEDSLVITLVSEEKNLKIEKRINGDVHSELDAADESVEFSLLAYTGNAQSISIEDTLPYGFVLNDEKIDVEVIREDEENIIVEDAIFEETDNGFVISIEDAKEYQNQYLQIKYTAHNTKVFATSKDYKKAQKENWQTIQETNIKYAQEHTGFVSGAKITAKDEEENETIRESNVVTVAYKIHTLKVDAIFTDGTNTIDWPKDASIKVKVLKIENGEGEILQSFDEEKLDADHPTLEYDGLLKYGHIQYSISETEVKNISDEYIHKIETDAEEMHVTITNEKQVPSISLHVNQSDYAKGIYENELTFSINAYITKDAESFTLEQSIPSEISIKDIASIRLKDLSEENNEAGKAIESAYVNLKDNIIHVNVDDASDLQGHFVQFDFVAVINENKAQTYTLNATYQIKVEDKVKYEATSNDVVVEVEYVEVENVEGQVEEVEEVVNNPTLVYETVDMVVNGSWNDRNNEDGHRPETTTLSLVQIDEYGIKEVIDEKVVSTNSDTWSFTGFNNLPTFTEGKRVSYEVQEKAIDFYMTKTSATKNTVEIENISRPWFQITPNNNAEVGEISILHTVDSGVNAIKDKEVNVRLTFNPQTTKEVVIADRQFLTTDKEIVLDYIEEGTIVEVKELEKPNEMVTYRVDDKLAGSAKTTVQKDTRSALTIRYSKAPKTSDENDAINYGYMFLTSLLVSVLALHILKETEVEA